MGTDRRTSFKYATEFPILRVFLLLQNFVRINLARKREREREREVGTDGTSFKYATEFPILRVFFLLQSFVRINLAIQREREREREGSGDRQTGQVLNIQQNSLYYAFFFSSKVCSH